MLQKQSDRAVGADQTVRFDFFQTRRLRYRFPSLPGLADWRNCAGTIPGVEIRILDRVISRFAGGLLQVLLPGLLAGACLAGTPGAARANQPSAQQDAPWPGEKGQASYYGPRHQGHRTASGARFEQAAMTAAHPWLPFGTKVRVTLTNGRSVVVTVTDRLPARRRVIDLSLAAARMLGIVSQGVAEVSLAPA